MERCFHVPRALLLLYEISKRLKYENDNSNFGFDIILLGVSCEKTSEKTDVLVIGEALVAWQQQFHQRVKE